MATDDWFRRTTWTPDDQAAFFARLARSRSGFHRSQYARIQAVHLQSAGLIQDALNLLERLFKEWPDPSQMASAKLQEGECRALLGDPDAARRSYQEAIDLPHGWNTGAPLTFAWHVATHHITSLYPKALDILDDSRLDPIFPVQEYKAAGARAIILEETGDRETAREYARRAVAASKKTESPFRFHRHLGLVRVSDEEVHERLATLAG